MNSNNKECKMKVHQVQFTNNYAPCTAFKAELQFKNAEKFLTEEEIAQYEKRAKRFGTPEDKITIDISTKRDPGENMAYQQFMITVLKDGKTTEYDPYNWYHWHCKASEATKLGLNRIFINFADNIFRSPKNL